MVKSFGPLQHEVISRDRKLIVRAYQDTLDIYDPDDEESTTLTLDWDEVPEMIEALKRATKGAEKTYWG